MPKSAFAEAVVAKASRERRAHRNESSIERAASSCVAGHGVHSSNTIAMSESSACCTSIEISGVSNRRSPLTGEANVTPSSRTVRMAPRLHTWKPPESVRIGRSHPMNRCSPRCARDDVDAGAQPQMERVAEDDFRAEGGQARSAPSP